MRPACPPPLYSCKYLNFSRSTTQDDLITRQVVRQLEGTSTPDNIGLYADPETPQYHAMLEYICQKLNFTSLRYHRLDDMVASVGLDKCRLCTYCWDGKE